MIDFGRKEERPLPELMVELLDFVSEATPLFGTERYVSRIREMAKGGSSAHRQIEVFEKTNDMKSVVDWLMTETMRGIG